MIEKNTNVEEELEQKIDMYWHCKGKMVKVSFLDGKTIAGKLLASLRYEIVLEVEKEGKTTRMAIFKHSLKYIIY